VNILKIFTDYGIKDMLLWEFIKRLCTNNIYLSVIIIIGGVINMNMILNLNEILTAAMIIVSMIGIGINMSRGNISKAISILLIGCIMVALIQQPTLFGQMGKAIITFIMTLGGGVNGN